VYPNKKIYVFHFKLRKAVRSNKESVILSAEKD